MENKKLNLTDSAFFDVMPKKKDDFLLKNHFKECLK